MQKFINVDPMEPGTVDEEAGGGGADSSEGMGLLYRGPEEAADSATPSGAGEGGDYSAAVPPPLFSFELGRQSDVTGAAAASAGSTVFSPMGMQQQPPLPRPKDRPTKEPKSMKQSK